MMRAHPDFDSGKGSEKFSEINHTTVQLERAGLPATSGLRDAGAAKK